MTDSLGTARLDLIVDTSAFEAAITRSRNLAAGMGTAAEEAFSKTTGKARTATESALRYAKSLDMTAESWKLISLGMRGVPVEILNTIRSQILAQRQETEYAATAAKELGDAWALAVTKAKAGAAALKFESNREAMEAEARAARKLADATELLDIKKQHAADGADFARMAADAERLRRGAQSVAVFTEHLDLMAIKSQHAADGADFARIANEAERLRRGAQAVSVFTLELDRLEAQERATASQQSFIAHLQQLSAAAGKTRAEMLQLKAAELGVSDAAAPFITNLKAQERALVGVTKEFNAYGLSTKQTAAALRGVPAQVTDIFVSLQGGQNPITVLLQQGGQLKDMFGGIVPAARALSGALLNLINPWTLAAAAVVGALFAFNKIEQQSLSLERALVRSGNQANMTAEDLLKLAQGFDRLDGVTTSGAVTAIGEVVTSGVIAVESLALVTEAALAMKVATGKAISETVTEFAELRKDPVAAILKLNEAQHFLTRATLDQIQAYIDSGNQAAAAALATETYANSTIQKAGELRESMGLLASAWDGIKRSAAEAGDEMIQSLSNADRKAKESWDLLTRLKGAFSFGGIGGAFSVQAALAPPVAVRANAATGRATVDSKAAADFEALRISNLDKVQRHELEINKIKDTGRRAGVSDLEIARQVAAANARYKESLGKPKSDRGARSLANAVAGAELQDFKDTLKEEQAAIAQGTKVLQAQYAAKLVSTADYYAQTRELSKRDLAAEEKAIVGQIAFLRSRNVAGKDSVNVQKQIGKLEAELTAVRTDAATAATVLGIQEAAVVKGREQALANYSYALTASNVALADQVNAQIASIGMGQLQAAQAAELSAIQQQYAKDLYDLEQELLSGGADAQAIYDRKLADLEAFTSERVAITVSGYDRMRAAEANWLNGVTAGVANWMDETSNVAAQTEAITTRSMDGIADALTNAALTGKLAWKNMLVEMLKDLTKFLMKQALLKLAYNFAGAIASSGSGAMASGGATTYAKGGVFNSPHPSLSQYSGQVVSKPTLFAFAKGAGVMGEAGPEAIMPLTRGANGKLGVKAHGGASGGVNINITTNVSSEGTSSDTTSEGDKAAMYKQFSNEMRVIAQDTIGKAMRPGGSLWRAGVSA